MTERLRIATFNLENLDDKPGEEPSLQERIPLMRPQLTRLAADVLCLQEVHGQEEDDEPRGLLALEQLLEGTPYAGYHVAHTKTQGGEAYDERNLVVLSRREILGQEQYMNRFCPAPLYKKVTADPPPAEPEPIGWERPILHVRIGLEGGKTLHIFNVHLKSKAPTDIVGQNKDVPDPKLPPFAWRTAYGWAEGFFVSSMKRGVTRASERKANLVAVTTSTRRAARAEAGGAATSCYVERPRNAGGVPWRRHQPPGAGWRPGCSPHRRAPRGPQDVGSPTARHRFGPPAVSAASPLARRLGVSGSACRGGAVAALGPPPPSRDPAASVAGEPAP